MLAGVLRGALLRRVAGEDLPTGPAASAGPPPPETAAAPGTGTGGRYRVLVVEDNPVNQMVAVGVLGALGYHATTADDGLLALEVLEREDVRRRADGRADAPDGRLRGHPGDP